ncbi:MAG: hypothetical protein MJ172_00310 [Clostridia bacterium]|nr:hypothetical protein [Clostridia bacterium]
MKRLTKKVLVLVTAVVMAAIISGCEMLAVTDIVINKDGSSKITTDVLMDEDLAEMFSDSGDADDLEEVERGKDTYYSSGEGETEKFKTIDDLVEFLEEEMSMEDVEVTTRSFKATIITEEQTDDMLDGDYTSDELLENDVGISLEFTVTFPYKVTDTNGDLSDDKKTVTWEIDYDDDEVEVYATCKSPILTYILIAVGVIVLIAIVVAVVTLIIKGKKKSDDDDEELFGSAFSSEVKPSAPSAFAPDAQAAAPSQDDYSRFAPAPAAPATPVAPVAEPAAPVAPVSPFAPAAPAAPATPAEPVTPANPDSQM